MKRHVLIFGLIGGILIVLLKWTEYRFLVLEHSLQLYGGLTAAIFALLGIWLGVILTRTKPPVAAQNPVSSVSPAMGPEEKKEQNPSGLSEGLRAGLREEMTRRELDVLGLIAQGLSNREIAGKLFVSENTVKTHCSRAFDKLGAKRRTQAVQIGKELGLIP